MRRYPNGAYSALQVGYAGSFDVELYTGVLPYDNAAGALIVWFFPFTDRAIGKKCFWLSGIYPLVYSIFSMVRGRFSDPTYYPYPFYNPEFIWETVAKNTPFNIGLSYLIIAALLIFGMLIFALLTLLIAAIHNKLIKRTK